MVKDGPQTSQPQAAAKTERRTRASAFSRYLIPLATGMLLGVCFLVYYLTYVQQNSEYLLNRNYRVLATLGEQMSATLANQVSTLASYLETVDGNQFAGTLIKDFPTYRPIGDGRYTTVDSGDLQIKNPGRIIKDIYSFAPRLKHIEINETRCQPTQPFLDRFDGEWVFRLAACDNGHDHEAKAAISMQDLEQSLSPSLMDTFDDVLLADEKGAIVFQRQKMGPHYSSVSDLLQKSASGAGGSVGSDAKNNIAGLGSPQLVGVEIAGVPYKAFLEPLTIDLMTNPGAGQPSHPLMFLVGLVPSTRLRWQSFAVPYGAIIFVSSVFLLLCLSTPLIKILFFNSRERLRLPEIAFLPLVFVTIASVLTSMLLQTIYFNFRHDNVDSQLEIISQRMSSNILAEIKAMRNQLDRVCSALDLARDRKYSASHGGFVIRKGVLNNELGFGAPYPYLSNVFWTDAQGRQVVKWSASAYSTPLVDVSGKDFFQNLKSSKQYYFLNENRAFRLDSVLPANQDGNVAVMGMKRSDCSPLVTTHADEFVFLGAKPLSLIDPYLPLGFSFALVNTGYPGAVVLPRDDTGMVLFHSDKYRNVRENFLTETGNDRELRASLFGHLNSQSFSLNYRGEEIRARVVPIAGVTGAPWSLIVYRDSRYAQTYHLEVITMSGTLLLGYLAIPALIGAFFYFLVRPLYIPEWLWPTEAHQQTYRFQIAAGLLMLAVSAALIFSRHIEESMYAAAASGYATLIMVFWSSMGTGPKRADSRSRWSFAIICGLAALLMLVVPLSQGWPWSVPICLILVPFMLALRGSRPLAVAFWWFPKLPYTTAYTVRTVVLLTVIGILPAISFFRNSMRLEDHLYIRAAQLHAASDWSARERKIEQLDDDIPGISMQKVRKTLLEWGFQYQSGPGVTNRCSTTWDFYVSSYFGTTVRRSEEVSSLDDHAPPGDELHPWFLHLAHELHHSFTDIGAEALGVLTNPAQLPEAVYSDNPEWVWSSDPKSLQLRMHQGARETKTCAGKDLAGKNQPDLLVSSALPGSPISEQASFFISLLVIAVVGTLFWLVTRKICLFEIREPLAYAAKDIREMLQRSGNAIVLSASREDWSADFAGGPASTLDLRALACEPAWAENFDEGKLQAGGTVIVENFDWELSDAARNQQRLLLLEKLIADPLKVVIVSTVDPFPFLVDRCGHDNQADAGRWASVLAGFRRMNLAREWSWPMEDRIREALPGVWQECRVQPELRRIGEDLWLKGSAGNPLSHDQTVSEVLERAADYYYTAWRSCTREECFLLVRLAEDGVVNPKNTASLRQLMRRGLIVRSPQFRLMNESFRRFVLAAPSDEMRDSWDAEAASSGWGKARGAFSTLLVLGGILLLATQPQFLHTSTGLLTAAAGGVAALLQLIGTVQGRRQA